MVKKSEKAEKQQNKKIEVEETMKQEEAQEQPEQQPDFNQSDPRYVDVLGLRVDHVGIRDDVQLWLGKETWRIGSLSVSRKANQDA